jgi:UDP-glucose 4-epimerase
MRNSLNGQAVLVTGGAGFIGSHLVDTLLTDYQCKVIVIDNLFVGSEKNLSSALQNGAVLYRDDAEFATSLEYIFNSHDIETVFNCATKALNYSFLNPSNAFDTNVRVVLNLLELQRKGMFKSLCHFSTSEVYGTAVYEPMDEAHPKNPTTTYAAGKAAADLAVESYVRMFDLDAFIVRPFNNYGPRQNFRGPLAGIIPITAARIIRNIAPEIHGSGSQSRDFIFVTDTVDAVVKLCRVLPAGETVNVSSDNVVTIEQLVTTIAEMMGYTGEILRKEGRKSDVFCHVASNAKIKSLIDYSLTPLSEGLTAAIDWYRKQLADHGTI